MASLPGRSLTYPRRPLSNSGRRYPAGPPRCRSGSSLERAAFGPGRRPGPASSARGSIEPTACSVRLSSSWTSCRGFDGLELGMRR